MSIQTQKKNMQTIHRLVSRNLGYIYGENESGPNGAKKDFLTKSAAFLRALGKDLGFTEMKVTTNPGGIAVSGEVSLYGMWGEGNGLFLQLFQSVTQRKAFLYRRIAHMKDYSGGENQWLPYDLFEVGDHYGLIDALQALKKSAGAVHDVA